MNLNDYFLIILFIGLILASHIEIKNRINGDAHLLEIKLDTVADINYFLKNELQN